MRFLVDECTGPSVAKWLKENGHQVYSVYDKSRGLDDKSILKIAFEKNYILITNDSDFGELVFRQKKAHKGVILLKLDDLRPKNKIAILNKLIKSHSESLHDNFVVASENKVKIIKS